MSKEVPAPNEKPIDMEQLEALCQGYMRLEDCAAFFKVSQRTIERRIREHFDLSFVEFRDSCFVKTRHTLIQMALDKAINKDNTRMHIHCLNNLCGWKSPLTFNPTAKTTINFKYNLEPKEPKLVEGSVDVHVEKPVDNSDTTGSGDS